MSVPWHTHVEVEISGKVSKGTLPINLLLEIYDNGELAGYVHEAEAQIGIEYFAELKLGDVDGNAAGLNLGEHTLKGKMTLSNSEGTASYDTDSTMIGIGQIPAGDIS